MAQTTYRIKTRGREWTTTDTDTAQRFAHSPQAVVTATTMEETDISGIPMQQLTEEQLQELSRLCEENEWWHIQEMAKDAWEIDQ